MANARTARPKPSCQARAHQPAWASGWPWATTVAGSEAPTLVCPEAAGADAVTDAVVPLVALADGFDVADDFVVADVWAVAVGAGVTSTR